MIRSTERDTLILNHPGLHPAMQKSFCDLGISIKRNIWQFDTKLLDRVLGVHIWFYDGVRHPLKALIFRQRLKKYNVPIIAWNLDAPHFLNYDTWYRKWRLNLLSRSHFLDIYASHTLAGQYSFANEVKYLSNAADIQSYYVDEPVEHNLKLMRNYKNYRYDVSFIGSFNGSLYKEDKDRQIFFSRLANVLSCRNISFHLADPQNLTSGQQRSIIQSSRINLNYGARCEYGYSERSGLPERCYGIPAAGGFLLSDRRTHAQNDFPTPTLWADFTDFNHCVDRISYWLDNFQHARSIAEAAHRHVMSQHTYFHRAQSYLSILRDWHAQKNT